MAIKIFGSRYGNPQAPKEDFHVWLCDENGKVIEDFAFPYASFARGSDKWVTLKTKPTTVPARFMLCAGFNPAQTRDYGNTLLQLMKTVSNQPLGIGLSGIVENKSFAKRRIQMISSYTPRRMVLAPVLVAVLSVVLVALTSAEQQTSQQPAEPNGLLTAEQRPSVQRTDETSGAPMAVKTSPEALSNNVDSSSKYITVTFNQEMTDNSWSWTGGGETYPQLLGKPQYLPDGKTCRLTVSLQPGKVYWVGINSPSHRNFKSKAGVAAVRYVILFATKDQNGNPTPIPEDMLKEAKRINSATEKFKAQIASKRPSAKSPREIALDDGTSAGKKSIAGSGHAVVFDCPGDNFQLMAIKIFGSRYGYPQAPKEDFHIWLCDENGKVIEDFAFPYASFTRGGDKWVTLKTKPTALPARFMLCAGFNPEQTKGIYVHHDSQADGNSLTGLPDEKFEKFEQGDWMIRAVVSENVETQTAPKQPSAKSPREIALDDGTSAGKKSIAGSGHAVVFDCPGDNFQLMAIKIFGSRYGNPQAPKEDFHIWLCDENGKVIEDFAFPYASFTRGGDKWVTLKTKPTKLPTRFMLCAGFNPEQTKGIYVHHDSQANGNSLTGLPDEKFEKFEQGDWMIRAVISQNVE